MLRFMAANACPPQTRTLCLFEAVRNPLNALTFSISTRSFNQAELMSHSSRRRAETHRCGRDVSLSLRSRTGRFPGLLFSKLDFFLVLRNDTTTATYTFQAVARNIPGFGAHIEGLAYSRTLNRCKYPVKAAEHSESYTRPIDRRITQHVCRIFSFVPQTKSILGFAIYNTGTK